MTLAPIGYCGSATHFGSNLAHKSYALVVTSLALNAIQNIPGANASGWGGIVWDAAKELLTKGWGNNVASTAKVASDYFTFKNLANKLFDPNLLNLPQFRIPFRAGMTAATLAAEALICKSAIDSYSGCAEQQVKTAKECSNIRINERNSKVNNCMEISEEKSKNECILKAIDDYNESEAKNKGDSDPLLKKCLAATPSCTVPWLTRDVSCAAMGGHAGFSAWALGKDLFGC